MDSTDDMDSPDICDMNLPSQEFLYMWGDESSPPEDILFKYNTTVEDFEMCVQKSKSMFIIEGSDIRTFAETCLLTNAKKLADIPSKSSSLHYVDSNNMLVAIIEEDLSCSGGVSQLLVNLGGIEDVITLTIKQRLDYKIENIAFILDEITFLRCVECRLGNLEPLVAPNFIVGVAAGVSSWRSDLGLPIQTYVAFTDNVAMDDVAAKPIIELLQILGIECKDSYVAKKRENFQLYM